MRTAMTTMMRSLFVALPLVLAGACGDDSSPAGADTPPPVDAPDGTADASCFDDPTTHEEIINGCTDAQKIYKNPVLPLLNPDGTLPDLP